jgi:hypothetical protein
MVVRKADSDSFRLFSSLTRSQSDDDDNPNFSTPRKAALFSSNAAATAAGFGGGGAMLAGGPGMGGGMPNNLGKVTGPAGAFRVTCALTATALLTSPSL